MKKNWRKAGIIAIWIAIWEVIALLVNNKIAFVGPVDMIRALVSDCMDEAFWLTCACSFVRIAGGFLIAFLLGIALAILAYRFKGFGEFISPLMTLFKTVPVASFIILILLLMGSSYVALFIAAIIVIPVIYNNTLAGLSSADPRLLEMAGIFEMSDRDKAWHIYRPALMPHLESSCRSALGMCWKAGIAAEVIGTPDNSIGGAMYLAKVYLATDELFAWTFVVILLSIGFEKLFMMLMRRIGR